MNIYFNYYWNGLEPEDGAYTLSPDISFTEGGPYNVFIVSNYSNLYLVAESGSVYVTHSNGKIQVTFCGLTMRDVYGGVTYTTTATGNLTAP